MSDGFVKAAIEKMESNIKRDVERMVRVGRITLKNDSPQPNDIDASRSMRGSTAYHEAIMCAFDEAADGVENWEFGGADSQEEYDLHRVAGADVAKRIRKMAHRYFAKHCQ